MKPPWDVSQQSGHYLEGQQMRLAPQFTAETLLDLIAKHCNYRPPSSAGLSYLLSVIGCEATKGARDPRKEVDPRQIVGAVAGYDSRGRWHRHNVELAVGFIAAMEETNPDRTAWFDSAGALADFLVTAIAYVTGERLGLAAPVLLLRAEEKDFPVEWNAALNLPGRHLPNPRHKVSLFAEFGT